MSKQPKYPTDRSMDIVILVYIQKDILLTYEKDEILQFAVNLDETGESHAVKVIR